MKSAVDKPSARWAGKMSVGVIMTGGTIAKSYDPARALLHNYERKVEDLIAELRVDDFDFTFLDLMHKDSLEIKDRERAQIVDQVAEAAVRFDAVLVTHGTDTMPDSAQAIFDALGTPQVPVVITGAMVPYSIKGSDAAQNVTEALLAMRLLPAGIFIAFHNRVLPVPGVRKNYESMTFEGVNG